MTAVHTIPGLSQVTDAVRVVRALHQSGPTALRDLDGQLGLTGWPAERIEQAVVSAWAENLIFVNPRDELVAL